MKQHVWGFQQECLYCGVAVDETAAELPCELAPASAPDYVDPLEPEYQI